MDDFRDVIARWGGYAKLAADLDGANYGLIQQWHFRNSIPPAWWPDVVAAAKRHSFDGITADALAELAARRKATTTRAA